LSGLCLSSARKHFLRKILSNGMGVFLIILVFDDEIETTNIFLADDPILKKLDTA